VRGEAAVRGKAAVQRVTHQPRVAAQVARVMWVGAMRATAEEVAGIVP